MLPITNKQQNLLRMLIFSYGFININSFQKLAGKLSHFRVKDSVIVDNLSGQSFVCLKKDAIDIGFLVLSPYILEFDELFWSLVLKQRNNYKIFNSFQAFKLGSKARLIVCCKGYKILLWLDQIQEYTDKDYHIIVSQNHEIEKYLEEKYKNCQNIKVIKPNFIQIQETIQTKLKE